MSITGKSSLSLKKRDVLEQKRAGSAYKRLVFAHKATLGDTGIDLTALSQPPEMASLGFTNPNTQELLAAKLLFHKKNLTVISSSRGVLIQDLSYTVPTSTRIAFQGFTADDGEIFTCILESSVKDGLRVVNATPIVVTGTLAANATTFVVGTPFEVNKYPDNQVGSILVFLDGVQQFRNTGNSDTTLDANYYEVDVGSGLGNTIVFNTADPVNSRSVLVVSNGLLTEKPVGSQEAVIETLAGQVDAMIPTLAALAGVPENTFQAAPNNVDLKTFGNLVQRILDAEVPIVTDWQDFPSVAAGTLITATTTNPTYGTVVYNRAQWRRVGEEMEIRWYFRQSSAGTAGSGIYLFNLPPGFQIDLAKLNSNVASSGTAHADYRTAAVGYFSGHHDGSGPTGWGTSPLSVHSATQLKPAFHSQSSSTGNFGLWSSSFGAFNVTGGLSLEIKASVPIVSWSTTETLRQKLGL